MESKTPKFALLVTLLLFGGLVYIMSPVPPKEDLIPKERNHPYRVQVEMRGFLENLAYDHVLIGDTFEHYAAATLPAGNDYRADWAMNFCCEKEDENPSVFQWWAEIGFSKGSDRMQMLKNLAQADLLQLEFSEFTDGGTLVGVAHASLPIPGQEGVLELSSVSFNFRTVFG